MMGILVELFLEESEQLIISAQELLPISLRNFSQIANHPAHRLKLPLVRQPNKAKIGGHIRKEGELSTAQGAELALALIRAETGK